MTISNDNDPGKESVSMVGFVAGEMTLFGARRSIVQADNGSLWTCCFKGQDVPKQYERIWILGRRTGNRDMVEATFERSNTAR